MRVERFSLNAGSHDRRSAATIHVGLVNNMPDAELRATELQFARLLKDAAGALDVRLSLFSLSGVVRSEETRARMEGFYADAATLQGAEVDALIVTAAEPRTGGPRHQPAWQSLAALIQWSQRNTVSVIYSGAAARAAALHLDGVDSILLPQDLCGVLDCERVEDDPLLHGMTAVGGMPHDRRGGLCEQELVARGYKILSRVPYGDPDIFLRPGPALSLFLQGRPEFDADTFARRFLRETGRFLRGEGERPNLPEGYFDRATEDALYDLAAHAVDASFLPRYETLIGGAAPLHSWRGSAVRLFGNWLTLVAAEKVRRALREGSSARRRFRA
jgi:homoserine O-succinyltransferase